MAPRSFRIETALRLCTSATTLRASHYGPTYGQAVAEVTVRSKHPHCSSWWLFHPEDRALCETCVEARTPEMGGQADPGGPWSWGARESRAVPPVSVCAAPRARPAAGGAVAEPRGGRPRVLWDGRLAGGSRRLLWDACPRRGRG